jgi:hypothetical protein
MEVLPYSPNLAPADVWLFPKLKSMLKESISRMLRILNFDIPAQDFKKYFEQWPKH